MEKKQDGTGDARATEQREFPSRVIFPIKGIGKGNIPKVAPPAKDSPQSQGYHPGNQGKQDKTQDNQNNETKPIELESRYAQKISGSLDQSLDSNPNSRSDRITKEVEDDMDLRSTNLKKNQSPEAETLKTSWFKNNDMQVPGFIKNKEEEKKSQNLNGLNEHVGVLKKEKSGVATLELNEFEGVTQPRYQIEEVKKENIASAKKLINSPLLTNPRAQKKGNEPPKKREAKKKAKQHIYTQQFLKFLHPYISLGQTLPGKAIKAIEEEEDSATHNVWSKSDVMKEDSPEDINVGFIEFNWLEDGNGRLSSELPKCFKCGGYLNCFSEIKSGIWKCNLCGGDNKIGAIKPPSIGSTLHVLEPDKAHQIDKDISIVICIDVSGTMSKNIISKNPDTGEDVYYQEGSVLPSVFEILTRAIKQMLNQIEQDKPDAIVGIVFFNQTVTIFGDGHNEKPIEIHQQDHTTNSGTTLYNNPQILYNFVKSTCTNYMAIPIKQTKSKLFDVLDKVEPNTSTALGPALVSARALLSSKPLGSQIVVFTDGVANTGCGNLDDEDGRDFYISFAGEAKNDGIIVSVFSIEGENCSLDSLLPMVQNTNGIVRKSKVLDVGKEIQLKYSQGLATKVQLTLIMHSYLEFRDRDPSCIYKGNHSLVKEYSEVKPNTVFFFEYGLTPMCYKNIPLGYSGFLYMQIQIRFTSNQRRVLRVSTEKIILTPQIPEITFSNYGILMKYSGEVAQSVTGKQDEKKKAALSKMKTLIKNVLESKSAILKSCKKMEMRTHCIIDINKLIQELQKVVNFPKNSEDDLVDMGNRYVTTQLY